MFSVMMLDDSMHYFISAATVRQVSEVLLIWIRKTIK
jgi:hypothetical protein